MKLTAKEAAEVYAARNKYKGDVMERREFKLPRLDYHIAENAEHPACLLIEEESGLTVATFTLSERGVSHCMRLVGEHNQHTALVEQRDRLAQLLRERGRQSADGLCWCGDDARVFGHEGRCLEIRHALASIEHAHEPQAKGGSGGGD